MLRRPHAIPSRRSLEWRAATAVILAVPVLLGLMPAVSMSPRTRPPLLLLHGTPLVAFEMTLAAVVVVLTVRPLVQGGAGVRIAAAVAAIIGTWRLAGWLWLLCVDPGRHELPFSVPW